ncbi:MAG: cyclic nucleotide-binding domain-containing protein [Acidobacteriota bacterium]
MAEKTYQSNELIFQKGDPSEFAYIIRSGEVEILRDYPDNLLKLAILRAGDVFGEMGLIDERPRSLTARATTQTQLAAITRDEFVDLIQNNPNEALKYLRMFFERLRAMNMRATVEKNEDASDHPHKEFDVTIFPLTQAAASYIPEQGYLIKNHIFRVGRNSNRHEDPFEINDLMLQDTPPYNISRNHFSIEKTPGGVVAHDRGSFLGTIINGQTIGGNHHGAMVLLKEGENEIIAGSHHSPFKFRVALHARTI